MEKQLLFKIITGLFIAFAVIDSNTVFAEEAWPVFEVCETCDRPKVRTRSILISDPGDTAEIGFFSARGTPEDPKQRLAGDLGDLIYWQPMDNTGTYDLSSNIFPWAGTGPYYGRSVQIYTRFTQDATTVGRGGTFVVSTTPNGMVATRERFWVSHKGFGVFGGRGSYEDGFTTYPEDKKDRFDGDDGLSRGLGTQFSSVQGPHDSYNTPGWAPVSIIASDGQYGPFFAARKSGNAESWGFDLYYNHESNYITFTRIDGGSHITFARFSLETGQWDFGLDEGTPAFSVVPTFNGKNRIEIHGAEAGEDPIIAARGTDPDVDLTLAPQGDGLIQFGEFTPAPGTVDISGYITVKDNAGNIRKLAIVE